MESWLPIQGSNLGKRIQSPLCYHYTNRQSVLYCRRSGSNRHEGCPPMVFETIASAYSATSALNTKWSGRRGSNSRPPPWQGGILPLNYFRSKKCRGPESDWRHADFQSAALPTELPRHHASNYTNYAGLTQPELYCLALEYSVLPFSSLIML